MQKVSYFVRLARFHLGDRLAHTEEIKEAKHCRLLLAQAHSSPDHRAALADVSIRLDPADDGAMLSHIAIGLHFACDAAFLANGASGLDPPDDAAFHPDVAIGFKTTDHAAVQSHVPIGLDTGRHGTMQTEIPGEGRQSEGEENEELFHK